MSKKESRLLIDDTRTESDLHKKGIPARVDVIARDYWFGVECLDFWTFDVLYIDHDLSSFDPLDGKEYTGYDIMCYLEKNIDLAPKKIICVSDNPPGKKRIEQVIKSIEARRLNGAT